MTVNGNGISTGNGGAAAKQLLQIIPVNIVVIITVIGSAVGLYYNLKADIASVSARISSIEKNPSAMTQDERGTLFQRVRQVEDRLNNMGPKIDRIETNVAWLVAREPNSPK